MYLFSLGFFLVFNWSLLLLLLYIWGGVTTFYTGHYKLAILMNSHLSKDIMLLLRLNGGGRSLFVHVVPMWSGEGSPLVNCPSTPFDWLIDFPDTQQQQQNETSPNITIPTNTQVTNGHSIRWVKLTSIIWEWNQSTIIQLYMHISYFTSHQVHDLFEEKLI